LTETIDPATASNVLRQPIPEGIGEFFQGTRNHIPTDQVKIFLIQQLFTYLSKAEDLFSNSLTVMRPEKGAQRACKLCISGPDAHRFEWEVTRDEISA
jgi:hypothetical protein